MKASRCPVCHGSEVETVFTWDSLPTFCNVLHQTREQALATERTAMRLVSCHRCGFIHNAVFEPEKIQYGPHYGNPLSGSPHFRQYATRVAEQLIRKYNVHDREIIEIGCGDGYFLRLLCDIGRNRGIGFDPSYNPDSLPSNQDASKVQIVADTYSQKNRQYHPAMVCCRHVLEHIHDPLGFLKELRRTLDGRHDCIVFFEVPDAEHTFLRGAVWDIVYEHCNYFTSESFGRVFEAAGFQVIRTDERYGGQFLTIEARPAGVTDSRETDAEGGLVHTRNRLASFQGLFRTVVDSWRKRMATWLGHGRQVSVWGAGTKGITFLNVLDLRHDKVECIVDVHPRKQGKFVPGTGQEVVGPEALASLRPDVVVVMNPLYLSEIRKTAHKYAKNLILVPASDPQYLQPASVT